MLQAVGLVLHALACATLFQCPPAAEALQGKQGIPIIKSKGRTEGSAAPRRPNFLIILTGVLLEHARGHPGWCCSSPA